MNNEYEKKCGSEETNEKIRKIQRKHKNKIIVIKHEEKKGIFTNYVTRWTRIITL